MKRLIIAGLLIFVVILLVTFPARVAYEWFVPDELQLSGISGSIWNGSAAEVTAAGAYIQNLNWTFKPLALLTGKLAFQASGNPASGNMQALVAISPGGTVSLNDLDGNFPLARAHPSFQQSGILGDVSFQFDTLVLKNGLPAEAAGALTVTNLFIRNLSSSGIGDFQVSFVTGDEGVIGNVEDNSDVLDVAGTISLNEDRTYSFIGQVAPTASTPPGIVNQLQYLGAADQNGQREFRFEGQL